MTIEEFSNEFDIYYNSIATNSAPGIDLYEKSVYLTKAQLEIVKNYFNPKGNKYREGFENSSKRRNDLNELIKNFNSTTQITSPNGIIANSRFFSIPNDTFIIIEERVQFSSDDPCINNKYANVIPKTHDEFNIQIKNPFKKPNDEKVWRMDYSSQNNSKNVEIISEHDIAKYQLRYIEYPEPIILTDLDVDFVGENLSIDGINTSQTCKLSESIHREILDRAVELALSDYKPSMLNAKMQLNTRNE